MFIKVTDVDRQTLQINTANVHVLIVPSPLSGGDGKCRLIVGQTMSILDHAEAARIAELLERA